MQVSTFAGPMLPTLPMVLPDARLATMDTSYPQMRSCAIGVQTAASTAVPLVNVLNAAKIIISLLPQECAAFVLMDALPAALLVARAVKQVTFHPVDTAVDVQ